MTTQDGRLTLTPRLPFPEFIAHLERALQAVLPGTEAQSLLAPRPRPGWPGFNQRGARHAAGLLLLFPIDDRPHLVLTVRSGALEHHGGQVSLPGGAIEPGETVEQAALREACEEIALATTGVRVLGALTPLDIPVSGFRLHPIVAAISSRPDLTPTKGEVARILEVGVDDLLQPARMVALDLVRDGRWISAPAFRVAGEHIWGATGMVLAEFLALFGWRGTLGEPGGA